MDSSARGFRIVDKVADCLSPSDLVKELDKHIVGHAQAKKVAALAMRNRWRRRLLPAEIAEEINPKNILMIGPTGVGKTCIAKRLAKIANAPFLKVEVTKFTEVGYVGRDAESIARDLLDVAFIMRRDIHRKIAEEQAMKSTLRRLAYAIIKNNDPSEEVLESIMNKISSGELDNDEVEIEVVDNGSNNGFIPSSDFLSGRGGTQVGVFNLGDILNKMSKKSKLKKLTVSNAFKSLKNEEADKLIDEDKIIEESIFFAENEGVVFLDEIDKIAAGSTSGREVNREGVQRDLLSIVEGTSVSTKYGNIKTDHVLFFAAGSFHVAKPSDLLPEFQGRFPVVTELTPLNRSDYKSILVEPEFNLPRQYTELLATEGLELSFSEDALDAVADLAFSANERLENIGARRLSTILEKTIEDLSYNPKIADKFKIDADYVKQKNKDLGNNCVDHFVL